MASATLDAFPFSREMASNYRAIAFLGGFAISRNKIVFREAAFWPNLCLAEWKVCPTLDQKFASQLGNRPRSK